MLKKLARWILQDELAEFQRQDEAITMLLHAMIHATEPERPKMPGKMIAMGRKTYAQEQAEWEWNRNRKAREAIEQLKMAGR